MPKQSTSTIVMVSPDHFGFNPQTAETNPFMHTPETMHLDAHEILDTAKREFNNMVDVLRLHGITVLILPSRSDKLTPDAVFPNNWFSHHEDGKLVLYPMLTPNRRLERQTDPLRALLESAGLKDQEVIDLTHDEEKNHILESTGSMVLDRVHKVSFAMASPRTVQEEFEKWCKVMDYEGVYLTTPKSHRQEVYHTNLEMCIGSDFAVVCLEVLEDVKEQAHLRSKLESLGKDVIEISLEQVYGFCGNVLELQSSAGEKFILMSETAHKAFTKEQLDRLGKYVKPIVIPIPTIEEIGGGGVRCMVAEIFT